MKPSSPGFSGSKSYSAVQQGCVGLAGIGVLAGERIGDGNGEAKQNKKQKRNVYKNGRLKTITISTCTNITRNRKI